MWVLGRNDWEGGSSCHVLSTQRGTCSSARSRSTLAIEQFHSDAALKGEPGRRSLELRKLLRRFTDVCNAMEYAHNRGVLHRDIKPSNIIVGKYGETLVVDWGLAKPLEQVEAVAPSGEQPLVLSAISGSTETLAGSALGTPAYMSPEQAEGDLERLGPWSDVYSLGATLYSVLTGKPSIEGRDVAAVLFAVKKGEFLRPRKLDPSIAKGLEAICLKAMSLQPEDRYGTPRALADDIEHWLADEPVKAHPEQRVERFWRWLRRHRTWALAAVAARVGTSLAATIGIVVEDGARRREAQVRQEAEANFMTAQQAVDDYLTSVSENTLLKQQDSVDIRSLRQELLNNALSYYKTFVKQRGDDPVLRRQLASAHFRVGEITKEIGSLGEAIEAFRSAESVWEPLAVLQPANDELGGRLADCYLAIGEIRSLTDDFQAAMTSLTQAKAILEPLANTHPEVPAYQASLVACIMRMGMILGQFKSIDQAEETLQKAKTIQERLISEVPGRSADKKRLAEIILAMGLLQYERDDCPGALQSFRETQRICQTLLDAVTVGSKPVYLLDLLAISHYNIAAIHRETDRLDEGLKLFERSLEYRSALVDAHPSITQFQEQLGKNLAEISVLQHDAHHDDKAFASIKRSIAVLEKLVGLQADQPRYHHDLGRSWNIQGYLHDEARRNGPAILAFDRAVAEQSRAVDSAPELDLYKVELWSQLDNLGESYVDVGNVHEGLTHYRREIEVWRDLGRNRPGNQQYTLKLAEALAKLGIIERHAGDSNAAHASYSDARSLVEGVVARATGDGVLQVGLGATLIREANALVDLQEPEKARSLLDRAVQTLSDASVSSNEEAQRRECLSEALWELARILRFLKNAARAATVDGQRVALWRDQPPHRLAALALKQTSQATVIGYGKTPVPPAALAVRKRDLERGAADLKLAVALGFRDPGMLQSHPESQFLLSREDVKVLAMDMAFPDRPFEVR